MVLKVISVLNSCLFFNACQVYRFDKGLDCVWFESLEMFQNQDAQNASLGIRIENCIFTRPTISYKIFLLDGFCDCLIFLSLYSTITISKCLSSESGKHVSHILMEVVSQKLLLSNSEKGQLILRLIDLLRVALYNSYDFVKSIQNSQQVRTRRVCAKG